MAASFPAGSAVLEGRAGAVRVVLAPGAKERPGLAPGPWRLRNTWIEREHGGEPWYLSASGPAAAPVEAKAGEPFPLEVSAEVRFAGHVKRHGKGLALGFDLKGDRGRGVSLWRSGKRIKVGYKVLGAEGKVLAEGDMTWG